MAPTDYVSDYETLTGKTIETKVIAAPETPEVAPATTAEVQ
ncbi:hypothetical protein [Planctomonas sp. JC2975]|nr:hypothetical protein [Planctomonas sp. JC2975]